MNILIQKSAYGLLAIAMLFTLAFSFGSPARAQSTSAQLEQIQTLLAMIEQLQAQLAVLRGESSTTGQCVSLSRSLYLGISDRETLGEVSKLQRFLTSTGHYTYGEITGYFGPATQRAVQVWQSSNGVVTSGSPETTGYGVVGPSTRSAIARGCVSKPVVSPVITDDEDEEENEDIIDPAAITNIQAKASDDGVVYAGEKAYIYGTGLKGDLTIKLGNIEPKYVEITSTSNTYAQFVVPEYSQTIDLSVRVTNSSGEASSPFNIRVEVASTQDDDEEETASHSIELYGEDKISGTSDTYELSPTIWQDVTLDVTNYTLVEECRMVASYDNGTDERDEQFIPRSYSNAYRVPTAMTLLGNFSFVTSLEADCEYYGNTHIRKEIEFATEDSDEEKEYRISFDGVDVKSGTVRKHKAFSECEKEYENSRDLQSSVTVKCYWDDSLFFSGGGKG